MATAVSNVARRPPMQVSSLEGESAKLATEGERFRMNRVKMDAAQRDVADGAYITHTTLGEIEAGRAASDTHFHKVRKSLLRIAFAKKKNIDEVIHDLAWDEPEERIA